MTTMAKGTCGQDRHLKTPEWPGTAHTGTLSIVGLTPVSSDRWERTDELNWIGETSDGRSQ